MKIGTKVIYRRKSNVDRPDFIGTVVYIEPRGRFVTVQGELYKESFDIRDLEVVG